MIKFEGYFVSFDNESDIEVVLTKRTTWKDDGITLYITFWGNYLWRTKDGEVVRVKDMDDRHLLKTYRHLTKLAHPEWRPQYIPIILDEMKRRGLVPLSTAEALAAMDNAVYNQPFYFAVFLGVLLLLIAKALEWYQS